VIESVQAAGGGTSTAFLSIADALARLTGEVAVSAFAVAPAKDDPSWEAIRGAPGVSWRLGPAVGRLRPGPVGRDVIERVHAGEIDVCHLHGLWSVDLVAAAAACRRRAVPVVWQPHGMLVARALGIRSLKKRTFLALLGARELRAAGALVFASRGELESSVLPRGCEKARCHVIPLPVQGAPGGDIGAKRRLGRERFGLRQEGEVVLFLGRLHAVKRVDLTLRAFAVARRGAPGATLLLVGAGDERYAASLRALAAELGIADRVVFAGWAGGADKWLALGAADVLILNSEFENFGYVIAEALGAAIPVVVTDNLAISSEVAAAGAGVAAQGEPDALGLALTSMLTRPDRSEAGRLGRAWVESTMSPEAVAARLLALYEAVTGAPAMVRPVARA
jgi:glycosyltransferase involved in cell wall biosynthesis